MPIATPTPMNDSVASLKEDSKLYNIKNLTKAEPP
jgi:hypothetical protein